jgi:DNA-binding NarL/FixJ family response regulator
LVNIRVAIFEPTRMSCDLMSRALSAPSSGVEVVYVGLSSELIDKTRLKGADVALIDSSLVASHLNGFTPLQRLSKVNRDLKCVLLLDRDERDLVIRAFRSGAVGVFQRDQSCEQLTKCIRCVHGGQVWANSQQMRYVLDALAGELPNIPGGLHSPSLLSKREEEIVSKVADGLRNRDIADLLFISENTIKNHLFRIYGRLGISSRAELILYAYGRKLSTESYTQANDVPKILKQL